MERTHVVEYGVLSVFVPEAFVERRDRGRPVPAPAALAIVGAVLIGACDEGVQAFVPSRVFDPRDVLFDTLAAASSVATTVLLTRAYPRPATIERLGKHLKHGGRPVGSGIPRSLRFDTLESHS